MTIEHSLLAQLAERRQFILYRLVQNGTKLDKVPTDPISGHNIDGQDSSAWMTGAEAAMWAEMWNTERARWPAGVVGYGVGLVLYEGCGQFALDLDKCREANGVWQAHVAAFEAMFPQAARETSVSGTGRHLFIGYRGTLPAHGTRNATYRMEGYSARRFIAVTGADAAGSVSVDYTAELYAFLARYFPPHADVDSGEWRDTPVPQWRGPEDDAELIRVALRERSASAVFNGRASFADLWTANADALARSFPPQNAHDAWDRSAADQALANKLAFYTGSNHERVLRLMREHQQPACALRRDKWEREGYIRGTIRRACADQREWYKGAPHAETVQSAPLLASTVPAVPAAADGAPPLPPSEAVPVTGAAHVMTFNSRNRYEATLENLVYVLGEQQQTRIGFDTFRGRIMVAVAGTEDWRPLTDVDMIQLRETLGRVKNFAPIGQELMRHALELVAGQHKFDSAIVWLDGLRWDGVPRVEQFLTSYCGASDDDYSRGVSRYIFTGLAARVYEPGCQLDMVVALHSKQQGLYKSTALQGLVPDPELFTDGLELHHDDDNFKRLIRGKLVVEVAELAGLSKADVTLVKRVITRRYEEWIEKWQTQPTRYPRRCMLFATTNEEQFLPKDETGQRRWVPVEIPRLDRQRIRADRDQLWAEGAARYRQLAAARRAEGGRLDGGVDFEDAERLAAGRHAKHEQRDVWEPIIERWLTEAIPGPNGGALIPPPRERPFTANDVLAGALQMNKERMDKKSEMRVASVLRQLGYEKRAMRIDGQSRDRWVPKA